MEKLVVNIETILKNILFYSSSVSIYFTLVFFTFVKNENCLEVKILLSRFSILILDDKYIKKKNILKSIAKLVKRTAKD
jgi:hypothetical protein